METPISPTSSAARLPQDIALDLLKFIANATNVVKHGGNSTTTGFAPPSAVKGDDGVTQLLDLYARCREAVE